MKTHEIEITEQMLDAGMRELEKSNLADQYSRTDRLVLMRIFQAMEQTRQTHFKKKNPSYNSGGAAQERL